MGVLGLGLGVLGLVGRGLTFFSCSFLAALAWDLEGCSLSCLG